jgi:two-component sensor histidine kinase
VLDSVRLLVTELVTNAIRHAGAPTVELCVDLGSASVRVEVANAGGGFQARPRSDQDSGWGLFLVDRLSNRWGVDDDPGHQRVWFEIERV